jgi:hypothetical protein
VAEKIVVEFPEFVLVAGAFARLRCQDGFIAQDWELEKAKSDFTIIDIIIYDLTLRVRGPAAAIWSLKVAELDQRDRGILISLPVGDLLADQIHDLFVSGSPCLDSACLGSGC